MLSSPWHSAELLYCNTLWLIKCHAVVIIVHALSSSSNLLTIISLALFVLYDFCEYTINFKIANITFNNLHYITACIPVYLHSLMYFHTPAHSLMSSNTNLLTIPFTCTTLGARSFSVTSPKILNFLHPALRSCSCPSTFTGASKRIHPCLLASFADVLCAFISFTYLKVKG